jgi:hypothetical protein
METTLCALIDWPWLISLADAHQGTTFFILTLGYVVATVWMACSMMKSTRAMETTIRDARAFERARSRPIVTFNIYSFRSVLIAEIHNHGLTPAFNVRVTMDPGFSRTNSEHAVCPLTAQTIAILAPGQAIRDSLGSIVDFLHVNGQHQFAGRIRYSDAEEHPYNEPVSVDAKLFLELSYPTSEVVEGQLKTLNERMNAIAGKLGEIARHS